MKYVCPECGKLKEESEFEDLRFYKKEWYELYGFLSQYDPKKEGDQLESCLQCWEDWKVKNDLERAKAVLATKNKIRSGNINFTQKYNEFGEKVYNSTQISLVFEHWNYQFEDGVEDEKFDLSLTTNQYFFNGVLHFYRNYSDNKLGTKMSYHPKTASFFTISDIFKMCVFVLEKQREMAINKEIELVDSDIGVCEYILNHKLIKDANLNYKNIKPKFKVDKRVFLYHFMKDYGRFPNEEEEVEYQKSFTEKEVEKMVEVYQKSLKKTKRS